MGHTGTQDDLEAKITDQLGSGKNRTAVIQNLVQSGMTESEASRAVDRIHSQMKKTSQDEEFSGGVLVPALLGGLIAAVIGGVVWGGIRVFTGAEIGFVAWGVGLLCGFGVVMLSQGKRGKPLQMIAVLASVLGIVIGKYITVFSIVKDGVTLTHGPEVAEKISLFSMDMVRYFGDNISSVASGFDILWIVLAVFTAWSIPKASGFKI